jgi:hypothetical protein
MIAGKHSQYERSGRVLAPALNITTRDTVIVETAEGRDGKTEWRLRSVDI